jgi:hypothetical protein
MTQIAEHVEPAVYARLNLPLNDRRHSGSPSRRAEIFQRVLVTIAAILSAVFAMECAARFIVALGRPPMFGTYEIDAKKQIAEGSGKDGAPRLFFLGTSLTSHGVYADLITDRLKRLGIVASAYNLGASGSYPADQLYLLRAALANENKAPTAAVVFEVSPFLLAAFPGSDKAHSEPFRTSYEGRPLLEREPGIAGDIKYELECQFWLIRYRPYLLKQLRSTIDFLCRTEKQITRQVAPAVGREVSPRGWSPAYEILNDQNQLASSIVLRQSRMKELFPIGKFDKTKLSCDSIDSIAKECATRKIPLVLLWLPMHPEYQRVCWQTMGVSEGEVHDSLQHLAQLNHARFLDMHQDNDEKHFHDCDHLNAIGAIDVGNRLATALAEPPFDALLQRAPAK